MSSYFQHMASKGCSPVTELDVIEFEEPAIEVVELRFDSTAECLAFIARVTGRVP